MDVRGSDYTGIPYLESGRDRNGIDCWGLVRLFLSEQAGIDLPSYSGQYDSGGPFNENEPHISSQAEPLGWKPVQSQLYQRFDVLLFHVQGKLHCGVMMDPLHFIEARMGLDSGSTRLTRGWRRAIRAVYRHSPS